MVVYRVKMDSVYIMVNVFQSVQMDIIHLIKFVCNANHDANNVQLPNVNCVMMDFI